MSHENTPSLRCFLVQPKASRSVLFSVQETDLGPALIAIATFNGLHEAQLMAGCLNGALHGGKRALQQARLLASEPGPRGKAIVDILDQIELIRLNSASAGPADKGARRLAENMDHPNLAIFSSFPVTACGKCSTCGCVDDGDCVDCLICGPDGRDCEDCGTVLITPRTAYNLYSQLRENADLTYLTVWSKFWQENLPDCVLEQSDWFLMHCARAFDDLACDLIGGDDPTARCLAESVAWGLALSGADDLVNAVQWDTSYQLLPVSRFDNDWDFLSKVMHPGDEAFEFIGKTEPIAEDLWGRWFTSYPGAERRDPGRGFRS